MENGSLRSVSLRVHFLCGARRSGRAGREGLRLQRRPGLGTGSGPAAGPLARAGWWAWSAVLLRQLVRSLPGHPTPLALTGLPGRPFSVSPAVASSPTAALRDDGALRFPPASPRDGFINSDSSLNPVLHLRSPCEPQELPLQRTKVLVFHQLKKSMISLWWATCFPRVFHWELYLGTRTHRVEGSIVSQASQSESYELNRPTVIGTELPCAL